MIIKAVLILFLLFLFYQDLRYRAVYWICFPVLLLILLGDLYSRVGFKEIISNSSINFSFLVSQLLLLTLYFSLKHKTLVNITRSYLGWGDVLFLTTLAFYLSPLNYILFYSLSLIFSLVMALAFTNGRPLSQAKIPLAGLQALLFAIVYIIFWTASAYSLLTDDWIIQYLQA